MENPFQAILKGKEFSDNMTKERWDELGPDIKEACNLENPTLMNMAEIATRNCKNAVELYAVATFLGKRIAELDNNPIAQLLKALSDE